VTDEHAANLRSLVDAIDRDGVRVAWEPRGDWSEHRERVGELCDELGLVHVVDPFRAEPGDACHVAYLRLHGRTEDPYDDDYDYDDALVELAELIDDGGATRQRVYCLFDNYAM